jgi:hypothetical protein
LPGKIKDFARKADLAIADAPFRGMTSWPTIEPEALECPALFYVGSKNPTAQRLEAHARA